MRRPRFDTWETGLRFEAAIEGGQLRWRRSRTDGSFCSASDPRVIFGLGEAAGTVLGGEARTITVRIHAGESKVRELRRLPTRRFVVVESLDGT
ncbi:MAG: hypothetical protein P8Y44_08830 [Acidobacteriota bacterium]